MPNLLAKDMVYQGCYIIECLFLSERRHYDLFPECVYSFFRYHTGCLKKIPSQDLFVYFLHGGKISLLFCLLFSWGENLNLIWIKFEFGLNTKVLKLFFKKVFRFPLLLDGGVRGFLRGLK